jgi:hypothetical protein
VITFVWKRPGVRRDLAREDDGHLVRTSERELVAQRVLEPRAPGGRAVEDARVGELELAEAERVAVAAAAVLGREGRRQARLPAAEKALHVLRPEACADGGERGGVLARAKAVVERLEGEPRALGLALRPLVAVEADPGGEGRVGARLYEGRAPLAVAHVEVVVVDVDRLAAELEVRVGVAPAPAPAAPRERLLLRDADQDDPEAARALGGLDVAPRHLLLGLALGEAHDRDVVLVGEALDRLDVRASHPREQRRRGDREAAVEQEAHELALGHEPRHVRLQEQPVYGADLERHVLAQ